MLGGNPSLRGASLFGVTILHPIRSFDLLDGSSTFYPTCDNMSPDTAACPQEDNTVPGWGLLFYRIVLRADGSPYGPSQGWDGLSTSSPWASPDLQGKYVQLGSH